MFRLHRNHGGSSPSLRTKIFLHMESSVEWSAIRFELGGGWKAGRSIRKLSSKKTLISTIDKSTPGGYNKHMNITKIEIEVLKDRVIDVTYFLDDGTEPFSSAEFTGTTNSLLNQFEYAISEANRTLYHKLNPGR